MESFCTLFDSNYMDKGLALYESILRHKKDFTLYIFAFDSFCEKVLRDLRLEHAVIIGLKEFETPEMIEVKKERSKAEYCWTCTPITIDYVFEKFGEPRCTYLDADLYFFDSPDVLLNEMDEKGDSVIITEHRFPAANYEAGVRESGKYCVQFNTFKNDARGREILAFWKKSCLQWCFYTRSGDKKGDQKYLECWTSKYSGVHELQNLGGGMAPWNVSQYLFKGGENFLFEFCGRPFNLVFYHFQNLRYLPFGFVNLRSGTCDAKMKKAVYLPYLRHTESLRKMLRQKYGASFSIKKSYFKNPLLKFIQNYIMPFKIKSASDLVCLKTLGKNK